jgi:transcriptional regulator with XRE-family HTH domain
MKEEKNATNKSMSVLQQIREKTNMSKGELASMLGVKPITISRWESGQNEATLTFKQFKILSYILRGMGVSISDLPDSAFGEIQGLELPEEVNDIKRQTKKISNGGDSLKERNIKDNDVFNDNDKLAS